MNVRRWLRALSSLGLLLSCWSVGHAGPIITDVSFLTERIAANTVPGFASPSDANRTQWNVSLISADPPSAVSVVASHPSFSSFNLLYNSSPIFNNYLFSRNSVLFSDAGLLAFAANPVPWSFIATDSTGSTPGIFPLIAEPQLVPFASNIQVSDGSSSPTISWMLPDLTGFDIDRVQLRAIDASNGSQIFRAFLPTSATSFTIPDGSLLSGHSYYYRVMLEDLSDGRLENRSNAFSAVAVAVRVSEPATGLLLAFGAGILFLLRGSRQVSQPQRATAP